MGLSLPQLLKIYNATEGCKSLSGKVWITKKENIIDGLCTSGYTKDSQKLVQQYRQKDRYNPSPETEAIANAKYQ